VVLSYLMAKKFIGPLIHEYEDAFHLHSVIHEKTHSPQIWHCINLHRIT